MAFERQKQLAQDPRPALEAIGLYLVGEVQKAFRNQGRGGVRWLPRAVPNRAGVLEDLKAGRQPPARRWDPRPAAIDTAETRNSYAFEIRGPATVAVGSNLDKAVDIEKGFTRTITLDGDLRKKLAAWLRRLRGERRELGRRAFGPLFRAGGLTITVPPRPANVLTAEDRKVALGIATDFFFGRR